MSTKELQDIRAQMVPKLAELAQMESYPLSHAEMAAAIKTRLADEKAKARRNMGHKLDAIAQGDKSTNFLALNTDGHPHRFASPDNRDVHVSFAQMLVAAAGVSNLEKLCVEALADLPLQSDKATRDAKLAALRSELDLLELAEERIINEAELDGNYIARRRDVRPEIVLAVP